MFDGLRLKRTCIASNNEAVMALNILCDGNHDHAPWSMENGIFDTAREAEYTPALSKALATVVLESLAGEHKLPNIAQTAKRLKLSHFQAIASGKQPTKALSISTVPDFAFVLVLSNLPEDIHLPLNQRRCHLLYHFSLSWQPIFVAMWMQALAKDEERGGCPSFQIFFGTHPIAYCAQ